MSQNAEVKMSRRRLLKLIAATGGAVAASGLVPAQWITPVVNVGTLPALAQVASPWVDLELREEDTGKRCEEDVNYVELFLDYYDPTGGITGDTLICLSIEETCQEDGNSVTIKQEMCWTLDQFNVMCGGCWDGDATEGSLYLGAPCPECDIPPECDVFTLTLLVWLEGSNAVELPCYALASATFIGSILQDMLAEAE
jgi:hypothetical protein